MVFVCGVTHHALLWVVVLVQLGYVQPVVDKDIFSVLVYWVSHWVLHDWCQYVRLDGTLHVSRVLLEFQVWYYFEVD